MNLLKVLRSLSGTAFVAGSSLKNTTSSPSWDLDPNLPVWERHPMYRSRKARGEFDADWLYRNVRR